jgi:hypothetical protein
MNHVYRRFSRDDLFHTTVHAQPSIVVESGSGGWTGNTNLLSNALSIYGGVRQRSDVSSGSVTSSGLEVYPIDFVDTNSIDKVVGVPDSYPQTGSIELVFVTNDEQPNVASVTNTRWYEEHHSVIDLTSDWYHSHRYNHYPALGLLPPTMSLVHVPSLFYGRQIATGSVLIYHHAFDSASGSNVWPVPFGTGTVGLSGTRYYTDDGYGRLFDVPATFDDQGNVLTDWKGSWLSGTAYQVGNVFYNEGLIVLTHPSGAWHEQFLSMSFNEVSGTDPNIHIQFSGSTVMKSMVFMCRIPPGEVNASNNPTFRTFDTGTGKFYAALPPAESKTYVTAVGLYNEERQLVAVAKLAQPIRKREQDGINIRLKLDMP